VQKMGNRQGKWLGRHVLGKGKAITQMGDPTQHKLQKGGSTPKGKVNQRLLQGAEERVINSKVTINPEKINVGIGTR